MSKNTHEHKPQYQEPHPQTHTHTHRHSRNVIKCDVCISGTLKLEASDPQGKLVPVPWPPKPKYPGTILDTRHFPPANPTVVQYRERCRGYDSDRSDFCHDDCQHTHDRHAVQSDTSYENAPSDWQPRSGVYDTSDDNTMESSAAAGATHQVAVV